MPRKGREHFNEYAPQTEAKHAILAKYFQAYVTALGPSVDAFHYVDGFAGRGTYEDAAPGSPLIAIAILESQSKPATASFIESDAMMFRQLQTTVGPRLERLIEPLLAQGEFSDFIGAIKAHPIYRQFHRVGTFAFVDPCGVRGVRIDDIGSLLRLQYGECLLFWNYSGLTRWIGSLHAQQDSVSILREFFGTDAAVRTALEIFRAVADPARRQVALRDLYMTALARQAGAKFLIPFRFEARDKARTSHYLIHCSTSPLAFKIMKEVMHKVSTSGGDAGTFEFLRTEELGSQTGLFRPNVDRAREEFLRELSTGPCPVRRFTDDWVLRSHDFLIRKQYRQILLDLESQGIVEVFDPGSRAALPARRKGKGGGMTLASRLHLRLRKQR